MFYDVGEVKDVTQRFTVSTDTNLRRRHRFSGRDRTKRPDQCVSYIICNRYIYIYILFYSTNQFIFVLTTSIIFQSVATFVISDYEVLHSSSLLIFYSFRVFLHRRSLHFDDTLLPP